MANQVETFIKIETENRNRKTVLFRGILVVPVAIYAMSLSELFHWGFASGLITLPIVLTLLFRGVYPSYVLTFNQAVLELGTRISSYMLFLHDDYPSIEANPNISIKFPDISGGKNLSRGLPLIKFILAIPLYIFGFVYSLIALLLTVIAWFHILFTGKYPDFAVKIVVGTVKFWNRVLGYAGVLVTDEYPSFSL